MAEIDTGNGYDLSVLNQLTALQTRAFSLTGFSSHPAPTPATGTEIKKPDPVQ